MSKVVPRRTVDGCRDSLHVRRICHAFSVTVAVRIVGFPLVVLPRAFSDPGPTKMCKSQARSVLRCHKLQELAGCARKSSFLCGLSVASNSCITATKLMRGGYVSRTRSWPQSPRRDVLFDRRQQLRGKEVIPGRASSKTPKQSRRKRSLLLDGALPRLFVSDSPPSFSSRKRSPSSVTTTRLLARAFKMN